MGLGTKRKRESLFVVWTWIGSAQCLRLSSAYGGNPGRGSLRSLCTKSKNRELFYPKLFCFFSNCKYIISPTIMPIRTIQTSSLSPSAITI